MKFTKIDVPNPSIQQVKLNGEMITIPSTYDSILISGDLDEVTVYLYSYEYDSQWLLAEVELDNVNTQYGHIRYMHDIYDGYDIDAAIEYALEQYQAE